MLLTARIPALLARPLACTPAVLLALLAGCQPPPAELPAAPVPKTEAKAPAVAVSADPWVLSTDRWDPQSRGTYLGSGLLGQRFMQSGTGLEAGKSLEAHVAGLYEKNVLVTLPPLLPLQISAGSHVYGADPGKISGYRQELRLREGRLVTTAMWDDGSGPVAIELNAAVLRQDPGLAVLIVRVQNKSRAAVQIGVPAGAVPETGPLAGHRSAIGMLYIQHGARVELGIYPLDRTDLTAGAPGYRIGYQLPGGAAASFALTCRVRGGPGPRGRPPLAGQDAGGPINQEHVNRWMDGNRAAWERAWAGDVEIDGDPEAQQAVRAALFYLLCSTRPDVDGGVPPMGLSSTAFNGHVFWDMDSWMLPALLPQHPELAKAMLAYRRRTLPGAEQNARAEGLPGASYAWESADTGREALTGQVFTHGRHVTGDVALALRQYYTATGDRDWLRQTAWPILKETAANWVARAKPDGKGGYTINGVTTPDENAGTVSHSAWTQWVARVNLEFAGEAARALGQPADPKWAQVAKGLGFLRDPSGLILPYEGFTSSSRAKQADVLLLVHPGGAPLSDAEIAKLYDYYAPRVIRNGPAMTDAIHALVAARLNRGEEALSRFRESYRPFLRPPFAMFSEKRSRDNLCFLTGEAGVVEAVLYGFAGLRLENDPSNPERPRLEPHLPADWTALRLHSLHWRGHDWDVEIRPGAPPAWAGRSEK